MWAVWWVTFDQSIHKPCVLRIGSHFFFTRCMRSKKEDPGSPGSSHGCWRQESYVIYPPTPLPSDSISLAWTMAWAISSTELRRLMAWARIIS